MTRSHRDILPEKESETVEFKTSQYSWDAYFSRNYSINDLFDWNM